MIQFVTDQKPGEIDILGSHNDKDLLVTDLDGQRIECFPAPANGWTHAYLETIAKGLAHLTANGANAFLGEHWVGSTEV